MRALDISRGSKRPDSLSCWFSSSPLTVMGGRSEEAGGRSRGREREDDAGDGGGGGAGAGAGREERPKPAAPAAGVGRVPLHRLFAFADRTDAVLMAVGTLTAVANGMAQPLMTFIFGDVIDAFGSAESSNHVLHRVVKDEDLVPPTKSKSDKLIEYAPPSEDPYIGGDAPLIKDIIKGKSAKRAIGSTSKKSSKKPKITPIDAPTAAALLAKAIQRTIPETRPETEQNTGDNTGLNSPHVSRPNSPELSASAPDPIDEPVEHSQDKSAEIPEPATEPIPTFSTQPTRFDEINLKQAQDSIDNSLFDFPIGGLLDEDEVQSANKGISLEMAAHLPEINTSSLPEDIKGKLSDLLALLEQDTFMLVQDAGPIRSILHQLRPHLNREAQAAIIPAAYIESRQIEFIEARQKISDHQNRDSMIKKSEEKKNAANATRDRIKFLEANRPSLVAKIDELKARKAELANELQLVNQSLEEEEKRLQDLPITIKELNTTLKAQVSNALQFHKSIPAQEGSSEVYQRVIDDVDQIRLRALNMIRSLL